MEVFCEIGDGFVYDIADRFSLERVHMQMSTGAGEEAEAVKEKAENLAARAKQAMDSGVRVMMVVDVCVPCSVCHFAFLFMLLRELLDD